MKVAILGKNGQVASELRFHPNKSYELKCFARPEYNFINDRLSLFNSIIDYKPDVIVNTVAYTNVEQAEIEKDLCEGINSDFVESLALFCKSSDIFLIHFSTDYVFDGTSSKPYLEKDDTNPINFYGQTKSRADEFIINNLSKYLILRVSWVFSKYGNNFVKAIARKIVSDEPIKIIGDQIGTPTSGRFIADVFNYLVINNSIENLRGEVLNISQYPVVSWYEFGACIADFYMNSDYSVNVSKVDSDYFNQRAKRPSYSALSNEKIIKLSNSLNRNWDEDLHLMLKKIEIE